MTVCGVCDVLRHVVWWVFGVCVVVCDCVIQLCVGLFVMSCEMLCGLCVCVFLWWLVSAWALACISV